MKRSNKRQLSFLVTISTVMLSLLGSNRMAIEPMDISNTPPVLKVITELSANTFVEGKNGPDGIELQLIKQFAKSHGLQLELIVTDNSDSIYSALDNGIADIALSGQPINSAKKHSYLQSPAYREASTLLIHKKSKDKPNDLEQIIGKKIVVRDTEENHTRYKHLKAFYGNLEWEFSSESSNALLNKVNKGLIDYTITDSLSFALIRPHYHNLDVALELHKAEPVGMIYSPKMPVTWRKQLDHFVTQAKASGEIAQLTERFYGHIHDFDDNSYQSISFLMKNRLPEFQSDIRAVANEFNMDWRLLAAIAFQESHWDPEATSKTGVRGLMMLTNETAMEMGVEDRINPVESLRGGARYFKKIYKELPNTITEPDRTWFALAAYNVGAGHLFDAIEITKLNKGNPDTWLSVKQNLPLLADKQWQRHTRYGYARGKEPVEYVQNIRRYYDFIEWQHPLQLYEKNIPETPLMVKTLDDAIQEKYTSLKLAKELQVSGLFF